MRCDRIGASAARLRTASALQGEALKVALADVCVPPLWQPCVEERAGGKCP